MPHKRLFFLAVFLIILGMTMAIGLHGAARPFDLIIIGAGAVVYIIALRKRIKIRDKQQAG
ncbi:MAG: hypothetical protein KDD36_10580 [Flavobacteriales bacterium]|nr:hypothetical protein [Flavobacteriales bacterium]